MRLSDQGGVRREVADIEPIDLTADGGARQVHASVSKPEDQSGQPLPGIHLLP